MSVVGDRPCGIDDGLSLADQHGGCGIIVRQLIVYRKILHSYVVSLSYDNRKIFCKSGPRIISG